MESSGGERGINRITLVGRLGRAPETRSLTNGRIRTRLSVGTSFNGKTQWHRVMLWDTQAENADRYLVQGQRVYVEGWVEYNVWKDKDGVEHKTTDIQAKEILYLERPRGAPALPSKEQRERRKASERDFDADLNKYDGDDVPF